MPDHSLKSGGLTQTLTQWGITGCRVAHALGGEDMLEITVDTALVSADAFAPLTEVELFTPAAVRVFRGVFVRPPRQAEGGGSQSRTFIAEGGQYWLKRLTMRQSWKFVNSAGTALVDHTTSHLILSPTKILGSPTSLAEVVIEWALDYAIAQSAPISYDLTDLPAFDIAENEQRDLKVWDVIKRVLGWAPYISLRWDYSGSTAELVFFSTLPSGNLASVEASPFSVRTQDVAGVERFTGEARHDLLVKQVVVHLVTVSEVDLGDGEQEYRQYAVQTSTVSNGAFGSHEQTIELRGVEVGGSDTEPGEPIPGDIARNLHAANADLYYDLSWRLVGETPDWTIRPGELWNVSNAGSGFSAAKAVCQSVARDIFTGATDVRCGPPTGGGRVVDLNQNRVRNRSDRSFSQTYGHRPDEKVKAAVASVTNEGRGAEVLLAVVNGLLRARTLDSSTFDLIFQEDGVSPNRKIDATWNYTLGPGLEFTTAPTALAPGVIAIKLTESTGVSLVEELTESNGLWLRAIDDTFEKSIAVGVADQKLFFEWFYANTSEGPGYINLISEIDAEDGATFRAIKEDHGQAIVAALDGENVALSWMGRSVGSQTTIFVGIGDLGSAGTSAAEFKTIEAGTNINFTGSTSTTLKINSTGAGAGGITQLTGDVTAGPGSGSQAATIANDAVKTAKIENLAVTLEKLATSGASNGAFIQFLSGAWAIQAADWVEVEFKNATTGACSSGFILKRA